MGLSTRPEINGVRVDLQYWVADSQRWRVRRCDTGDQLGVKVGNLVRDVEFELPEHICTAVCTQDTETATAWLDSGGNIDAPSQLNQTEQQGATLLMLAARNGCSAFVAELLRRGADVNCRDYEGKTALIASLHDANMLRQLLEAGAQLHLQWAGTGNDGWLGRGTALEVAIYHKLSEAETLLRQHEPDAGVQKFRDVYDLENELLTKVLAANMLEKQARLGDFMSTERVRWLQHLIKDAFADPIDVASLSRRIARHGSQQLELDVWSDVAKRETARLSRSPRFKAISMEVSNSLPGLTEFLSGALGQMGLDPHGYACAAARQ